LTGSRGKKGNKQSKLEAHSTCKHHLTCMTKWEQHVKSKSSGSIHEQLSSSHKLIVEKNRKYIKTLIEITLFLGNQGLAFRGHDESKLSSNKGNFKETCDLLAKNCPEFEEKYSNTTNFTSHLIQDELVNLSAASILSKITEEIKCNKVFGIMIDEARCFKEEQMSVCVRYTVGLNVVERFLGFVDVSENQNAESLCAKIFEFLTENQLDKYHIVAQSYDGASVMSGKFNGVQSK
ncbi:zinc finger MYM-type protein 1-like, partial [Acyrthosiphon pisum]|uniref:DUF4371 domain-containing protein n=1 Tax=Acyrthosiphon pisum TaxID=7029 RepID=A0A8R2BBB8_ACYPI